MKRRHLGLRGPAKPIGAEVLRYLAHLERTAATKTFISQRAVLTIHLVPQLTAGFAVDAVTREEMQPWVDRLVTKGNGIGTVRTYLAVARAFFRWRSDDQHDPTHGVKLPDFGKRDIEPWTDDELVALRAAADALDQGRRTDKEATSLSSFRLLLELGLGTGCRIAELGALT